MAAAAGASIGLIGGALTAGPSPAGAQPPTQVTIPILPATTTTAPTGTTAPPPTTATTPPKAPAPATAPRPAPTTAPKPHAAGVPAVPVGGPPSSTTTTVPGAPPAPPAPPPDPGPVLSEVQADVAQLTAIDDYKPAETLVGRTQQQVTLAGAGLQSARHALQQAQTNEQLAAAHNTLSAAQLRALAVEAYIGVGYSTPLGANPENGNGDQGSGTVSTPGGLTGLQATDAKEMLVVVGQRVRQNADQARTGLDAAVRATARAQAAVTTAQNGVSAAEEQLLSAQQTLKVVAAAATNPTTASATALPDLTSVGGQPATTDTVQPAKAGIPGAAAAPAPAPAPQSPTIMGKPRMNGAALAAWFQSTGRQANTTVPITQLAADYDRWGQKLGVADDIAFAQSVVETGFFSFPTNGQLTGKDNNFAGIGACDTCSHGWSFPDAGTGVGAQVELLYDYANNTPLPAGIPNVIGSTGVGGCCSTWMALAGTWASSLTYGISIMTVYHQMLSWYIPQAELSSGIIAPSTPVAQGPSLAPLPGAKKG